jgi:hypothetical protein
MAFPRPLSQRRRTQYERCISPGSAGVLACEFEGRPAPAIPICPSFPLAIVFPLGNRFLIAAERRVIPSAIVAVA